MSNTSQRLSPRTEAQPFPWKRLSEAQREAAEGLCALLGSIDEQRWEPGGRPEKGLRAFLPRISSERRSHVLLIDGARGSGKSALLLTLLDAWEEQLLAGERQRSDRPADVAADEFPSKLLHRTSAVVPVGLVDLEALSENTNLLLQVVSQFQRLVQVLDGLQASVVHEHRDDRAPWEGPLERSPIRKAWRDFLSAAALGGMDGIIGRRAHVDPEAFVVEMEETELQRRDIQRSFQGLVDELARQFRRQRLTPFDRYPLFVIAVDDADMSHDLTDELLRLARELWHPRVVFLMTGSSELFRARIREKARMSFHHLWQGPEGVHRAEPVRTDLTERVRLAALEDELVDQGYRKAIPPGHRFLLPPLPAAERAELLRDTLEHVAAPGHPLRLRSMADYLDTVTQVRDILPGNFRQIRDLMLWPSARQSLNAQDLVWALTLGPHDYAARHLTSVASVKSDLWNQVGRLAGGGLTPRSGAPKQWRPGQNSSVVLNLSPASHAGAVHMLASAELLVSHRERPEQTYRDPAAWQAAVDAVWGEAGDLLELVPRFPGVVRSVRGTYSYEWPSPDWRSAIDFNAFWRLLTLILQGAPSKNSSAPVARAAPPSFGTLVKWYLTAVLDYSELRARRASSEMALRDDLAELADRIRTASPSWEEIAGRACKHVEDDDAAAEPTMRNWVLRGAGLLGSPEIAFDVAVANEWLRALRTSLGGERWNRVKAALPKARAEMLHEARQEYERARGRGSEAPGDAFEDPADEVPRTGEVDERKYEWASLFEEESNDERSAAWQAFLERLETLPVRAVEPHVGGPLPLSLQRYVIAGRRTYLQGEAPVGALQNWLSGVGKLGRSDGEAALAVLELWAEARKIDIEMPAPPQDLVPLQLAEIYGHLRSFSSSWHFVPASDARTLTPAVAVRRGGFRWTEGMGLRHPFARIVFEIAWDYTFDREDASPMPGEPPDPQLRWWRGGGGAGAMGIAYPWPAVDWWSFLDHILLAVAWNHRIELTARMAETLSTPLRFGDDLAFWYIRFVEQLAELRDRRADVWRPNAGKQEWQNQLRAMREHLPRHRGSARWGCYEEWFRRVPLLAAPESGLSRETGSWILEATTLDEDTKRLLREQRRLRIVEGTGQDETQADEVLARIDREAKDHPWTQVELPG